MWTNEDGETLSWLSLLHPAGVVIGLIVIFALIGWAFRKHYREGPLPWLFLASVASWAFLHEFIVLALYNNWPDEFSVQGFAEHEDVLEFVLATRLLAAGPALTTTLFAMALWLRCGPSAWLRLAAALVGSSITQSIGTILCYMLPVDAYPDVWQLHMPTGAIAFTWLPYHLLPNLHSAIGWIIWYLALFTARPNHRATDLES